MLIDKALEITGKNFQGWGHSGEKRGVKGTGSPPDTGKERAGNRSPKAPGKIEQTSQQYLIFSVHKEANRRNE